MTERYDIVAKLGPIAASMSALFVCILILPKNLRRGFIRQFKVLTVFLLLFGLTIAYSGCNFFGTPQTCLSSYLDSLEKKDYAAAYKLLSVKDKEVRTLKAFSNNNFSDFNAANEFLTKNTKYKITEVKENKDKAVVKVVFTRPNLSAVWEAAISETLIDKNEMDKYIALDKNEFKSKIPFESISVSYNLVEEKDGWKIFFNFAETDKKAKEEKERKRQLFEIYKNKVKFTNIEVTQSSYDNTFSIVEGQRKSPLRVKRIPHLGPG